MLRRQVRNSTDDMASRSASGSTIADDLSSARARLVLGLRHPAAEALHRGDVDELADFRGKAPGMPYAHPTVEHSTPLFVTLDAATDPTAAPTTTVDGYAIGLARRSFHAA